MTDNDEPAPPRGSTSSAGRDERGEADNRSGSNDAAHGAATSEAPARVSPTDPEVPSAKRRGAVRHLRSIVALLAVVMGLLSITLALLYRASQQVRAGDDRPGDEARERGARGQGPAPSIAHVHESTHAAPSYPSPSKSDGEQGDIAPLDDEPSNDSAPTASGAPSSKIPAPALDIIRKPAF